MSRFSQVRFLLSAAARAQFPADHGVEVAFAGRSNSGKSTAINAIAGRQALARTSKTPGRTRLLNFFELGPQRRIVDLPGYGYANAPPDDKARWAPLLGALRERYSFRGLFLIVDSRRGLSEADVDLLDWAEAGHRTTHVLISKSDKLNRADSQRVLRATREKLLNRATAQLFSAKDKVGVDEAQRQLEHWFELKDPDDLVEIAGAD